MADRCLRRTRGDVGSAEFHSNFVEDRGRSQHARALDSRRVTALGAEGVKVRVAGALRVAEAPELTLSATFRDSALRSDPATLPLGNLFIR